MHLRLRYFFLQVHANTYRKNNPGFSNNLALFESWGFSSDSVADTFETILFKILIPRRLNPSNEILFCIADF